MKLGRAWYLWLGLHVGIPYGLILDLPMGELFDIVAVDCIQRGVMREKGANDEDFWSMMERM